jgi:hypothetical protein
LPVNIRLGWKWLTVTNTLAYSTPVEITALKFLVKTNVPVIEILVYIERQIERDTETMTLQPNNFTRFHSTCKNMFCCSFKALYSYRPSAAERERERGRERKRKRQTDRQHDFTS